MAQSPLRRQASSRRDRGQEPAGALVVRQVRTKPRSGAKLRRNRGRSNPYQPCSRRGSHVTRLSSVGGAAVKICRTLECYKAEGHLTENISALQSVWTRGPMLVCPRQVYSFDARLTDFP